MIKNYFIILIFCCFILPGCKVYGDDSGTESGPASDTETEKHIILSYVLDAGIILDYGIADIGLNALFRFYINPRGNPGAFTFGCASGIIYEDSSSNTYTLYSFPLLFIVKKPILLPHVEIFIETGAGPAFNYELMPVSYSGFTCAAEITLGCSYNISRHVQAGLFFKVYVNNILESIPRTYLGARGSLVY
jgi:hypothetical protein